MASIATYDVVKANGANEKNAVSLIHLKISDW
jgi:hypothetical protein